MNDCRPQIVFDTLMLSNRIMIVLANETTKALNSKQKALMNIKWSDGEANVDTEFSILACKTCVLVWNRIRKNYKHHTKTKITCTIPDVNIQFTLSSGKSCFKKIELKSSLEKTMVGSTIRTLNINQSLIYCLRPKNKTGLYKLRCSQYHEAMGEGDYDKYQDRTPRPIINFEKMNLRPSSYIYLEKNAWIKKYAVCAHNRIQSKVCNHSWQDDLTKGIIDIFVSHTSFKEFKRLKSETLINTKKR